MNAPSTPPLFLQENPVAVPSPRAVERATMWAMAGLGGLAATGILVFAVSTQSGADAERIAASPSTQLPALIGALAATHGRPGSR